MNLLIDKTNFTDFLSILSSLSKYCLDVDIKSSRIRIRSNNKVILYDIKLSEAFNDLNLPIPVVSTFVDVLRLFIPEENENVQLNIEDKFCTIIDSNNRSQIRLALSDDLQNKFVDDENLKHIGFNDKILIGEGTLTLPFINKINNLQKILATSVINIDFNKQIIFLQSEAKTKVANLKIDNVELKENNINKIKFSYGIFDFPFTDDVSIKVYKLEKNNIYLIGVNQTNCSIYSTAVVT